MKRKSAPLRWTQLLACAYALALALACHARWMPPLFIATLLGTVALRVTLRKFSARRVHVMLKIVLMIAFGALVIRTFNNLFGREAGSGLLAAMLALKLVESETRRDGLLLLTVTCFLAMCGFLFDQGILQATLATVTLAFLMAGLNVLQPLPDDAPAEARRDAWWPYKDIGLASLGRLLLLALPFAAACFLFFPRIDRPMWGAPEDAFKGRTGISERMTAGSLAGIALDDRVAFQVRFDGAAPAPRDRYYRALTMDQFDGTAWTPGDAREDAVPDDATALGARVPYEILLQPTDQRWLPLLDLALTTDAAARIDASRQATARDPVVSTRSYRAISATQYQLRAMPPTESRVSLRLPRGRNPQARALAERWRSELGTDHRAIVQAALKLFHDGFSYSLEPPPVGANGVDDFLFQFRSGYCEHFAGAFAFLMRAAGVPTRVVIGFQGGYFNATGGFFNVRYSDAHAWNEVWFPDQGWVRVDPTAAVSPERVERGSLAEQAGEQAWYGRGGFFAALRDRAELVGYWWNQAVVQFTALRQRDLMEMLKLGDDSGLRMVAAMVISALLGLAFAGWLGARALRAGGPDPLVAAYRRYCGGSPRRASSGAPPRVPKATPSAPPRCCRTRPARSAPLAFRSSSCATLPTEVRSRHANGCGARGDSACRVQQRAGAPDRPELAGATRRSRNMFTRTQHLLGACLALGLASCATVPKTLQGEFASGIPTGDALAEGALVRWGGQVISVEPGPEGTCFQILSRELNADARPKQYGNASGGRFLACHTNFFDPALYPEGTDVTITGNLAGFETRKIGDFDLSMPRVATKTVYLWPDRPEWPYDYGYGPYPGYYDPFWWGFYPRFGVYYGGYHGHHGGHHHPGR